MLLLEGLVDLPRIVQLLQITCWGIDLDYCDALEMNRDHSVIFEIASKYCISDSFVEYEGYLQFKGLKSLLQHNPLKASVLQHSAFFIFQLSHSYMTTGKTIALTKQIFVGKVMSLLFNMLSRLVIASFSSSKHLLISWLQSPSAVILKRK